MCRIASQENCLSCVVVFSKKLSEKMLRERPQMVNRLKISNILPDQSFFERDIKSYTTDSEEFFETIFQALRILTIDSIKQIIMTNIKEIYQDKENIAQLILHFESIYTLMGDSQYTDALNTSFKNLEKQLRDSKIISELKRQLHNMRMGLHEMFKKLIMPYLSSRNEDGLHIM